MLQGYIATMAKTPKQHTATPTKKPLKMKLDLSPMKKKSKWGNYIDVYQTKIDPLVIIVATRYDKAEGSYITPMIEAFEDDANGELTNKWKVLSIFPRRGVDGSTDMVKGPANKYTWECMVAYKDEDDEDTAESLGKNIALQFSEFAKKSEKVSS